MNGPNGSGRSISSLTRPEPEEPPPEPEDPEPDEPEPDPEVDVELGGARVVSVMVASSVSVPTSSTAIATNRKVAL